MTKRRSTLRSAAVVASGTLLSRVLGLVRVMAMAYFFGQSGYLDAFFIAFLVPNLFRKLFGEGALSAAVVPVLTEVREKESELASHQLVASMSTLLTLVLAGLTIVATGLVLLLPGSVVGWEPAKWSAFQEFFVILGPLVLLLCLTGLQSGVLNTYGRFAVPALLPALHNLVWIGSILVASLSSLGDGTQSGEIRIMCWGLLIGAALQLGLQMFSLRRAGISLRPRFKFREPRVREIMLAFGPTVLALAVFQVNTLLDLLLAEWLVPGDGAVSAYSYANTVFQFPLGIVGIALGTAIFPMLSRYAARGEPAKVTGGLLNGLRLLGFIVFPAAAGLLALNSEIVTVLLARGEFSPEHAERTASVLMFFSLALPFVCCLQLVTKAFYALKDTRTPTRIALISVGVNLVLNVILVQTPLREAGLALSTCISSAFNLCILGVLLARRLHGTILESRRLRMAEAVSDRLAQPLSPSGMRRFRASLVRSLFFSLAMGSCVLVFRYLTPDITASWGGVGLLVASMIVGGASYACLHVLIGSPELREFRGKAGGGGGAPGGPQAAAAT